MTLSIRVLIAVLLVAAIGTATAIFVASRGSLVSGRPEIEVATTGDLLDLFSSTDPGGGRMAELALRRLESSFYKPVDPQTPITGEIGALREYLGSKKISDAQLPIETANGQPVHDGLGAAAVLAYAQQHYGSKLGTGGRDDLTEAAIRGIMKSVNDPYTVYLSSREYQGLNESLSGGNFGGIGVYIYQLKDGRIITQPIETLPAARAGMKPGEIVDQVDGKPVRGLVLDRVEQLIRGEPGTTVHLRTHPYNAPSHEHSYAIVREVIVVPTVRAKIEGDIDYIRLSDFGTTSGDEVRRALLNGEAKGAKGYILDLRDNGGGLLDAAVAVSSLFVPQGTIVSTIRRDGEKTSDEAIGDAIGGLGPLVILVNHYTASASEITAGALQDYHLATLVGTRTFGKGVVQSLYPLPDESALKITTARYVTPSGRDIQHRGIEPDIVVDQSPDPSIMDTKADKQLAAAKARLQSLIR